MSFEIATGPDRGHKCAHARADFWCLDLSAGYVGILYVQIGSILARADFWCLDLSAGYVRILYVIWFKFGIFFGEWIWVRVRTNCLCNFVQI